MDKGEAWNHNVHYHDFVLRSLLPGCRRVLDVGCGYGQLARKLATHCQEVVAIDSDHAAITGARDLDGAQSPIEYVEADVMTYPFASESFDCITVVAALHHLPLEPALMRFRNLLRAGGVLIVIGLYRPNTFADYVATAGGIPASLILRQRHRYEDVAAPVVAPTTTLTKLRLASRKLLAGSVVTRRLLFRYSLVWRKLPAKQILQPPNALARLCGFCGRAGY